MPLAAKLISLGERIRARRKLLGVSATDAAEAAGISRVTLHRIERGGPSVAMAAYANAVAALGLEFDLVDPQDVHSSENVERRPPSLPSTIPLADYPQLERLAWTLSGAAEVTPEVALGLYERNWRHVDPSAMEPRERALVEALASELGGGRLLV
jgi:transcriptional regulator with XRE-family HTH domain